MEKETANKLITLIKETNMYYDLNYDDVAWWIIDNQEILMEFLKNNQSN